MDEYEDGKTVYWFIFFGIIIFIAIGGFFLVRDAKKKVDRPDAEPKVEEEVGFSKYVGVWQLYGDDDSQPERELWINAIDDNKVSFDYVLRDNISFENYVFELDENTVFFEIVSVDKSITLTGKITFKNDKVYFIINSSNSEKVTTEVIEFDSKSDYGLLK